jgi:hypothetical protein
MKPNGSCSKHIYSEESIAFRQLKLESGSSFLALVSPCLKNPFFPGDTRHNFTSQIVAMAFKGENFISRPFGIRCSCFICFSGYAQ